MFNALRVEVGCTSIVLHPFFAINLINFMALSVSVFIAGRHGGKTRYPLLIISLSAILRIPFFGRLKGASIAIIVGALCAMPSNISLFVCIRLISTFLFFHRAHPVGFFGFPARSIPIITLAFNFSTRALDLYIGLLFRCVNMLGASYSY